MKTIAFFNPEYFEGIKTIYNSNYPNLNSNEWMHSKVFIAHGIVAAASDVRHHRHRENEMQTLKEHNS